MFGISFSELFLIIVIFLIFLGPERLPEVFKTLGRIIFELKGVGKELKDSVTNLEIKQSNERDSSKDKEI